MVAKELRKLLEGIPDDMPVGVAYPNENHAGVCNETTDVRTTRVSDPFHKFAGETKEVFVIEVY